MFDGRIEVLIRVGAQHLTLGAAFVTRMRQDALKLKPTTFLFEHQATRT